MAKKSIFIGSAKETVGVAKKVAQVLGEHQYNPVRWWTAFEPNSITIDALANLARHVDGAVFLFTGLDKTWYHGSEVMSPRDNVNLEYGLFVGTLGVLILKDDDSKLPSDLAPITFAKMGEDIDAVPEQTLLYFDRVFSKPPDPLDSIPLVADPA